MIPRIKIIVFFDEPNAILGLPSLRSCGDFCLAHFSFTISDRNDYRFCVALDDDQVNEFVSTSMIFFKSEFFGAFHTRQ